MPTHPKAHYHCMMKTKQNLLLVFALCASVFPALAADANKPNVIYLMLDEWGYFESGHMGSKDLLTPHIDQFAQEGMRFTQALAGAPVCGPTRCVLLTGLHSGHTSMRGNNGFAPIREDEPTLASMLKAKGLRYRRIRKVGHRRTRNLRRA